MGTNTNNSRAAARTRKMRARSHRLIKLFIAFILVVLAFLGGFALRGQSAFLQSLGFPASVTGLDQTIASDLAAQSDVYNSVSARMAEVETLLASDSLDSYDLAEATGTTLNGLAEASNDPYLRYYSPERYTSLLNSQDEGYAGVGVLFSEYNGKAYVVDVFEGSPAQLEGVREGDFVVSINGDNSQTWSRSEVAAALSQEQGSTVVITWRRPESLEADGGEEFTTTLACEEYNEVNVTTEYNSERTVGYIKMKQLTQNASALVQSAIADLTAQGARSFVLDLRDNPGGYLSQAVGVASQFMSSGTVVEIQTVDGQSARTASGQPASPAPLVVITNKNTAAAAEVVAAALKESQRATLVGTNTMGKGSVQVLSELSFGGALRYTAAYYLTPEGHAIDQVGVTPEVILEATGDGDPQKDYAIELAASQVVE
ncbi:MAG: PDZ domain-containing protein [Eggerthellaceae bacterium]|nr:PDZ domain-containing protein [Eggerthellaceae bacterium]